ncbi:MAG TPA: ATP-dependent helicase [Acidimicrobiia bacterium]|nr:ATP-dependent helicase [Acidimicrobiia bacterium]
MLAATAEELNRAQRSVVEHGDGALLVVAGAGTGKTKTLAARVATLLRRGVPPERILLLTFTRRAAAEMLRRAARSADPASAQRVWGGTFHAVGHRILRVHGAAVGLGSEFSVLDPGDAADLMGLVRSERSAAHGSGRFPRQDTLLAIYSRVANMQRPLREVLERTFPWCAGDAATIGQVFNEYVERKRAQQLLDFDDLLLFWAAAVAHSSVGPVLRQLFDHVLVDEYQDTNALQAGIVRAMARDAHGVMVVGDDAQAIYSFRAATVQNILAFPSQYPGASVIALEENYRSTPSVLAVANAVIAAASARFDKQLWSRRPDARRPRLVTCADEQAQAAAVVDTVLAHYEEGIGLRNQAVLFRAAHHSAVVELELGRRNVPFVKYGGLRFLEAAHIKDLLALLRVLDNPYDELAWFRALRLADGVGPGHARRLLATLGVRPHSDDAATAAERLRRAAPRAPKSAQGELAALADGLTACADGDPEPTLQIRALRPALDPLLRRRYERAEARLRDLEELEHLAAAYRTRSQLVAELTLDPPAATGDLAGPPALDEDYLVLSTVHSAKGGEWDAVHIIHAADGMFPSDLATRDPDEIEEERRLFYVALTRARDHLHVYFPLRYFHRRSGVDDAHHYAQLTRFLPSEARRLFDCAEHGPRPAPSDVAPGQGAPVGLDVDAALRSLWR